MQAQMTPATAPGIAGLMQGKPQGGPNPMQPMPASPGSVNQIKDMYGTKTVPRDMKALLALNEALAQVKSAENQNALQQQIPQQNIKEQMSSEAQNILQQAQGVTGASQQQEQQKQAALQRLAQGIARAPGADQVMPQRMAGGGIVAFQNRGEVPFPGYQDPDVDENGNPRSQSDRARIMRMNAALQARSKKYLSAPELYSDPVMTGETYRFLRNRLEEFPPTGPRGGPGFVREGDRAVLETLAQAEEPPVQPDTMQAQMPEPPQAPQQPPMRMPPAQVQSKVPVQGAPAALEKPAIGNITPGGVVPRPPETPPMKPPAAAQPAQAPDIEALIQKAREEEQKRAMGVYGRTDAEKAPIAAEIARLQKPKPEKRWYENIADLAAQLNQQRIQPGQQGIVGGLGRIASAGAQMSQARKTEEEARRKQLFDLQTKLGEMDRQGRIAGYEAGVKGGEAAGSRGLKGHELGITKYGIEERGRIDEANRVSRERMTLTEIESRERVAQKQIETQAQNTGQIQLANRLAVANTRVNDAIEGANKALKSKFGAIASLIMMDPEQAKTKNPQQYEAYKQYEMELKRQLIEPAIAERDRISMQITGGAPAVNSTQTVYDFNKIGGR